MRSTQIYWQARCSRQLRRRTRRRWTSGVARARTSFAPGHANVRAALVAIARAVRRLRQVRNRLDAARARTDTRAWVVARRTRTKHLIDMGGLVQKAGHGTIQTAARRGGKRGVRTDRSGR